MTHAVGLGLTLAVACTSMLSGQARTGPRPTGCLGLAGLQAGTSWTYAGSRRWSVGGSDEIASGAVRWTMSLLERRTTADATWWLVRGFVSDLAFSDPTTRPALSLLVCRADRLLHTDALPDSTARALFAASPDSVLTHAELLFQAPLTDGAVQGQDPPRNDTMYGWFVEVLPRGGSLPATCRATEGRGYRLTLQTLPDHQAIEWRAGLGIASYRYGHHGTVASADVHLTGCVIRR